MRNYLKLALVAAISFGTSGCATVINGTNQSVDFISDPDGAIVYLSGGHGCTTPCEFELKRGKDLRVDFEREGYKPEFVYIQSRLGGSAFGNIIAGGGLGAVVDGTNGASNRLYPRPIYIRLVALGSDEEAVLLDKDGVIISSVAAHNESVGEDVRKGLAEQGLVEPQDADAQAMAEANESAAE